MIVRFPHTGWIGLTVSSRRNPIRKPYDAHVGSKVESAKGTSGIKGLFDNITTRVTARANQPAKFAQVVVNVAPLACSDR